MPALLVFRMLGMVAVKWKHGKNAVLSLPAGDAGLVLQPGEALAAIKSPLALAFGLASILLITPMLSFALLKLPLQPAEMALGLAIYCCMPTSLSTNIALTQVRSGWGHC